MTLNAHWFPIAGNPGRYRAACGKRGCCPELAAAQIHEGGEPIYSIRAGMTIDRERSVREGMLYWRLSPKAEPKWKEFQRAGGGWKEFRPEGRHYRRVNLPWRPPWLKGSYTEVERGMQHFPVEESVMPVLVACPMCTWPNLLVPVRRADVG